MQVPADIPVARPEDEPTVATAVLLLLHIPPTVPSARVEVALMHRLVVPVMGDTEGNGSTTNAIVAMAVPHVPVTW